MAVVLYQRTLRDKHIKSKMQTPIFHIPVDQFSAIFHYFLSGETKAPIGTKVSLQRCNWSALQGKFSNSHKAVARFEMCGSAVSPDNAEEFSPPLNANSSHCAHPTLLSLSGPRQSSTMFQSMHMTGSQVVVSHARSLPNLTRPAASVPGRPLARDLISCSRRQCARAFGASRSSLR